MDSTSIFIVGTVMYRIASARPGAATEGITLNSLNVSPVVVGAGVRILTETGRQADPGVDMLPRSHGQD